MQDSFHIGLHSRWELLLGGTILLLGLGDVSQSAIDSLGCSLQLWASDLQRLDILSWLLFAGAFFRTEG